jgi:hypothetical protein
VVEPERDRPDRSEGRGFRPWTWFWLWCIAGAAVALAVGGTLGWVLLAVLATAAMFLFAVIARIEDPPPPPRRLTLPEAALAPLAFVAQGRTDLFASRRLGSMVSVELVGEQKWSLNGLEWGRTYAVQIPPGPYEMRLRDPRGRMLGNQEVLDVILIPEAASTSSTGADGRSCRAGHSGGNLPSRTAPPSTR